MIRKILLLKEEGCIWTYLIENGDIVEIHPSPLLESKDPQIMLGNIYIGKVQNIAANIGAAFVDIGGVNCYYDVSQAAHAIFTNKAGKKPLCIGDELLVQISREAVKTKAPTVSSNISLTGRYAVLTSGNTRIGVSSKLTKALRESYKEKLQDWKSEDYGIIVRTNAKEVPLDTVLHEITQLKEHFYQLKKTASSRTCYSCLYAAAKPYLLDLKNVYAEGLSEILVEDHALYEEILGYSQREQPEFAEKLQLYENPSFSLSKLYSTETVLEHALREHVWLKHGGYLIIQPTEALTVIDVNSGKCVSKKQKADGFLQMNLEAAKEIAKQIRLRNLSGIIIVDFINMERPEETQKLLAEFRKALSMDPIQTTLVDVTGLQLVEITRKKLRKPLHEYWKNRGNGHE
ncbi:MAG: ribonuclease E/G [Ruminococcus sp.]|nr:ribonuclease E/G [Ruminococcus sp.]